MDILFYDALESINHTKEELKKVNFPLTEFKGSVINPLGPINHLVVLKRGKP